MTNKIILTEETSILEVLKNENWLKEIKDEFQKVVEFSSKLEITDFEDKKQIEIVKTSKQGYVTTRNTIKRAFKSKRDINTEQNRLNLEAEREVLEVMEKEEKRLWEMLEKAEKMKLRKENEAKLDDRINELSKYEHIIDKEVLLGMKDKEFDTLLLDVRFAYMEKKEKEVKAEQERIAREKELEEVKKQAKLEAEQEAQKKADLEKQKVEQEKREAEQKRLDDLAKAEKDKQDEIARIKKEQEEKDKLEQKRKDDEENARLEQIRLDKEKVENEKREQEQLERRNEYKKFRESFGYNELLKNDFIEQKEDWKIILFKKVWEFNI